MMPMPMPIGGIQLDPSYVYPPPYASPSHPIPMMPIPTNGISDVQQSPEQQQLPHQQQGKELWLEQLKHQKTAPKVRISKPVEKESNIAETSDINQSFSFNFRRTYFSKSNKFFGFYVLGVGVHLHSYSMQICHLHSYQFSNRRQKADDMDHGNWEAFRKKYGGKLGKKNGTSKIISKSWKTY